MRTPRKGEKRPAKGIIVQQEAQAREREAQAMELRKAGASYPAIARQLGYASHEGARQAVVRVLDALEVESAETGQQVRRLEMERLDALLVGLWQKARNGDVQAVDRALKIMERRARLMGLDRQASAEEDNGPVSLRFVVSHD